MLAVVALRHPVRPSRGGRCTNKEKIKLLKLVDEVNSDSFALDPTFLRLPTYCHREFEVAEKKREASHEYPQNRNTTRKLKLKNEASSEDLQRMKDQAADNKERLTFVCVQFIVEWVFSHVRGIP